MSTKSTIFWDGNNHIYQECFDEKSIYIERNVDKTKVVLEIDLAQALSIVRCMNYESAKKQSELTDEHIEKYVISDVEHRIKNCSNPMIELHGSLIYGSVEDPKDIQIQAGLNYYKNKRNYLKRIIFEIESARSNWPYQFGLEELI